MTEYILKDFYNGEVVYKGTSLTAAKKAAREYDYETEGDWIPVFGKRDNPNTKYHRCEFKY